MARKARVEGSVKAPESDRMVAEAAQHNLAAIVDHFKAQHPDEWEALRLCPLQHGLETMIDKLKA